MAASSNGAQAVQTWLVIARLNDKAQPLHRGELYEDPLDEVLHAHNYGEVTGGGTQLGEENEIVFCDVEIELTVPPSIANELIKATLERLGAPKGSSLLLENEQEPIPFGLNEGLAVYLNGTDLPPKVYKECDSNYVYSEFKRLLGNKGSIHSYWQGPRETALYLYGRSFQTMQATISGFLGSYPLCEKARIVQIA